jgi:hypothetical protein
MQEHIRTYGAVLTSMRVYFDFYTYAAVLLALPAGPAADFASMWPVSECP